MRSTRRYDIGRAGREARRLETPGSTGFRAGMSSSGMIGYRLGSMFGVPADTPGEFDALLRALDSKVRPRARG